VNLREQLERASGNTEAVGGSPPSVALRVLLLAALPAFVTFALGTPHLARTVGELAGGFAINVLLVCLMAIALRVFRPKVYADGRAVVLLAALLAVVVGAAAVVARLRPATPELVPIALVGLVVTALFDRRVSLLAVVLLAALVAAQPAFRSPASLPVLLVTGAASALVVRTTSQRDQSHWWMLGIAVACSLALAAAAAAYGSPDGGLPLAIGRGAAAAVVSVMAAMLVMPLAERLTGRETHLTLLEWGDLNRPLLQRLSLEAPGTYAHTIAIANLAEAGSRAIGANALLARVGAYYHDIGKLAKPQYFVENQPRGRNLHDKLKPHTSAAIIRNHVREGLELAEQARLPASLCAFITEHHGTGTISFFLEKAREREGSVGNTGDFTYPGPLPQSAETAIVMLADGVEAAARALAEPTPERIREVIDRVVQQRIDHGQLREAPLTLRQLTAVKLQFARVLGGMYHARVDYPTPTVTAKVVAV
jgi:hypothetical protein